MNVNLFGCLAEYKFAVMAMEYGINVSFPLIHSSPYDCIIETKKVLKKIQIKAISTGKDKARCYLLDSNRNAYKKEDVDFFAVWVQYHNGFYIFKNENLNKTMVINKGGIYSKNFNNFAML
tara:strand:+ start:48 stop:410 length:363 start_codon:yes stop_codon:yes gene_type:complete